MNQPLTAERIPPRSPLDNCLNRNVKWSNATGPAALWRAKVGTQTWTVRVNDFPEELLYTLFVNDEDLGSFDEWPRRWSRAEVPTA